MTLLSKPWEIMPLSTFIFTITILIFFKRLLTNAGRHYSHFVIIAHFLESGENAYEILNTIPKEKLILLDKLVPGVSGDFSAVYENFESDIYGALEDAVGSLKNMKH